MTIVFWLWLNFEMHAYCWIQIWENSFSKGNCIFFISTILGSDVNLELKRVNSCLNIKHQQLCEFTSNLFIIYMLLKGDLQYKLFPKTHFLPSFHKNKLRWFWVISVETRKNKQKQTINSNRSVCHPMEEDIAYGCMLLIWVPLTIMYAGHNQSSCNMSPINCCFHKYIKRKKRSWKQQPWQP